MIHYISKFGLAYVVVTNNPPISVDYNNKDLGFFFFFAYVAYLFCGSVWDPG